MRGYRLIHYGYSKLFFANRVSTTSRFLVGARILFNQILERSALSHQISHNDNTLSLSKNCHDLIFSEPGIHDEISCCKSCHNQKENFTFKIYTFVGKIILKRMPILDKMNRKHR